jgi:hypothetical protein
MSDEKFVEVANKNAAGDGMSEHDRKVLTRKILVKLDFRYSIPFIPLLQPNTNIFSARILPVLTLLFLCSFLDRTNVGNAKTYGLEASLKMTDWQYDTGLAVYYATYIARYEVRGPGFLNAKLAKFRDSWRTQTIY